MAALPGIADLVQHLAQQAATLADSAAVEVPGAAAFEADAPVREMLQRASHLVKGAGALGQQQNPCALGLISRALLENLILMLWVQADAGNASILRKQALSELARIARANLEKGKLRVVSGKPGEDKTSHILQSDRFVSAGRPAGIETRAKDAGVEDLYAAMYRLMSPEARGLYQAPGESDDERSAIMEMQTIEALALASGHAGVRWLVHRQRTDNGTLRQLLGLERDD